MPWPKFSRPDLSLVDFHVYGGLLVAAVGGWQLSPAWTLVIVGASLTAFGVFIPRRKGA